MSRIEFRYLAAIVLIALTLLAVVPEAAAGASRQVLLEGKPISTSALCPGDPGIPEGSTDCWIPLEDLAKLLNGTAFLEPRLKLQGRNLYTAPGADPAHEVRPETDVSRRIGTPDEEVEHKVRRGSDVGVKVRPPVNEAQPPMNKALPAGLNLRVARAGLVSSEVQRVGGELFVPLQDVAEALGLNYAAPPNDARRVLSLACCAAGPALVEVERP